MSIISAMPPVGVGVYARSQSVEFLSRFDFVALRSRNSDGSVNASAEPQAAQLKAAGTKVWLYSGPSAWRPGGIWAAEVEHMRALARRIGASGIIADPEDGWRNALASEAESLGKALAKLAGDTRVGVTSFPLFPHRSALASACAGRVWASPQLYEKGRPSGAAAAWFADWQRLFGARRVIPSVSGWRSHESIGTRAQFRSYLERMPKAQGAIAWTTNGAPAYFATELVDWNPAGNVGAQVAYAIASAPVWLVAACVAALIGMVAIL